jgi:hypothetical protein
LKDLCDFGAGREGFYRIFSFDCPALEKIYIIFFAILPTCCQENDEDLKKLLPNGFANSGLWSCFVEVNATQTSPIL